MDTSEHTINMDDMQISNSGGSLPLPRERNLFFTSQVDQASISSLTRSILEINANDALLYKQYAIHGLKYEPKPIKIYIDSYGGYVYQCFGLLAVMDASKTPIHTIVTGTAMSCGFMIAIHGHKRYAYKYATLMYHQVSGGIWGKVKDMQDDLEETKRLQEVIETITVKKTSIDIRTLKDNFERKKDWYMDAEASLKFGCIDEIIK